MKKILLICALCLLPITTMAEEVTKTCNGGTLVTSHKSTDNGCTTDTCNEHVFCKSDAPMNWWSAWAWCESQHRNLADISVMCPHYSGNYCANLHLPIYGYVWSKTASGNTSLHVDLLEGIIDMNRNRDNDLNSTFSFCD